MQNRILTLATIALLAAQLTTSATSATRAGLAAERRLQLESPTEAAAALCAAHCDVRRRANVTSVTTA